MLEPNKRNDTSSGVVLVKHSLQRERSTAEPEHSRGPRIARFYTNQLSNLSSCSYAKSRHGAGSPWSTGFQYPPRAQQNPITHTANSCTRCATSIRYSRQQPQQSQLGTLGLPMLASTLAGSQEPPPAVSSCCCADSGRSVRATWFAPFLRGCCGPSCPPIGVLLETTA